MSDFAIIVPCRLESTRFPRKLLHQVHGKPLILWTAERVRKEAPEFPLYFAVDHEALASPLRDAGFTPIMTDAAHQSGTDRIAEANREVGADYVINVQADEPLVTRSQILALAAMMEDGADMATMAIPFKKAEDFYNPNQVKVVFSPGKKIALYFSRSPIPHARDLAGKVDDEWVRNNRCYRHLGLYAYTDDLLRRFANLPRGEYEQIEKLEQLRVLENGYTILCDVTEEFTVGIDTPEDAVRFEEILEK